MLSRAKFLRLSGVAAAALAVIPAADTIAKSSDGVVRVKSAYGFAETIERLKKDTDLQPLRSREDFKKLMGEVEKPLGK